MSVSCTETITLDHLACLCAIEYQETQVAQRKRQLEWNIFARRLIKEEDVAGLKVLLFNPPPASNEQSAELLVLNLFFALPDMEKWTETTLAIKNLLRPFLPMTERKDDRELCDLIREQNMASAMD